MKSTNSSLQNALFAHRRELDNYCNKTKEATKDVLVKCEALRDNLKAAAARNAEQDQYIEALKQELADLKVKAAKRGEAIENMEKLNDQLESELEQLEPYNQYLANESRKKDSLIDRQKSTLRNQKAKTNATEKCLSEIPSKNLPATGLNRPATLYEILLIKSSAAKDQIRKHYNKRSLLTHPDAGGDEEFFETFNWAYQILENDAAREAYNKFVLDEAEKILNNRNW